MGEGVTPQSLTDLLDGSAVGIREDGELLRVLAMFMLRNEMLSM